MGSDSGTEMYEALPIGASEACVRVIDSDAMDAFAHAIKSVNPIPMEASGRDATRRTRIG